MIEMCLSYPALFEVKAFSHSDTKDRRRGPESSARACCQRGNFEKRLAGRA